jgi:integrase
MAMQPITMRTVEALKPGQAVWDAEHKEAVRGFGVRRQRGAPVYVVKFRVFGRQRFITIGPHGAPWTPTLARREAKRLLGLVANGQDPQAEKAGARAKAADTLGKIASDYLVTAKTTQRPRTFVETTRHLMMNWRPLHSLSIFHILRRHIAARLSEIVAERGTATAADARKTLSAMFNWAIREGYDINNPVIGTNRPAQAAARTRVLSGDELARIWRGCDDDDFGRIIRLLALTAQRRNEVSRMAWAELDLDRGVWTIPGARTKNHREHILPLPAAALALLPPRRNRPLVFGEGFSNWTKAKARLDAKAKIAPYRIHDLRRAAATGMAELGVQPHIIEAVLNHVSGHKAGVAGIYNRAAYTEPMREALQRWADHVEALIVGPRKQPVPIGLMERAFAVARGSKIVPEEDLANLARQLTPLKRA